VPFWDITVSVSKSITLFYRGLLAAAETARRAGDTTRANHLERRAGRVWAAIMEGNQAALEYLQDEAGITRTGYHRGSGTESGAELGKWEHARDWVVGSFRQQTPATGTPSCTCTTWSSTRSPRSGTGGGASWTPGRCTGSRRRRRDRRRGH
jgi:hypothetical protein